jgi:hypothetical protein
MAAELMQKGMFVYPWDVMDGGMEQTVQKIIAVGCDRLIVNSSYHHVRAFRPALHSIKCLDQAAASFAIDERRYGRLKPRVHQDAADAQIIARTRAYCQDRKIHFSTWWVGLHNSSLGQENPDVCMENIWGDRYLYALCPANEAVRKYATAFFEDTLREVQPESIIVESAAFMTFTHGEHHELTAVSIGQSLQWLLSLCFCRDCCHAAETAGCDLEKTRQTVRRLLAEFSRIDTGNARQEDYSIAFLLLEHPELYEYQRARNSTVTHLVKSLGEIAAFYQVRFDYIASSLGLPVNQAYYEGVSLTELQNLVNGFVLLAYGDQPGSVLHAIRSASASAPNTPIHLAFSLCDRSITAEGGLQERVRIALGQDIRSVNYYNYGLLNDFRLNWIKNANSLIDQAQVLSASQA